MCAECRERLDETDSYVRAMRRAAARLLEQNKQAAPHRRETLAMAVAWPRLAWGLAAILALAAVFWLPAMRNLSGPAAGPPLAVTLYAFRSDTPVQAVPAGRALVLEADLAGAGLPPRLEAQIVTAAGREAGRQAVEVRQAHVAVPVPEGLSRGSYWVRLLDAGRGGEIVREFALRVE